MIQRRTALVRTHPRTDWGGSYADSGTWAHMFRSYSPHNFGLMGAQTFSTQLGSHIVNKPLLWLTQGQGNTFALAGGHHNYQWQLATDGITRATIVAVDPNLPTQPGKSGGKFKVGLDRAYYHEPVYLKTEGRDMPRLKIHGFAEPGDPGVFWYTVSVQDGDPTAWVFTQYLQPGKTMCDAGTGVSDELNQKWAGIEFGSHTNLESQIGYVGRKIEVTDKFIRLEKGAREKGMAPSAGYKFAGKNYNEAVGTGYVVAERNKDGKIVKEAVEQGGFITTAEAILEERIAEDKEYGMTFGRVEISKDSDTGRPITTGAGWLQMARDGNYSEHNGDLTLADFTERLDSLYFNSVDPSKRVIYIRTGQEGIRYASQLIEAEAGSSPFVFDSVYFIDRVNHNNFGNERKFGAQFTEFHGYNGMRLIFQHDPTKDNPYWYPELHPDTGRPIESGSYDIMDLGETDAAPSGASTRSNLAYVYEPDAEEYFMVSNVYDLMTGAVQDGSNVASTNKEAGIYRTSSYKLEIWDISRTMRLAATA